MAIVYMIGNEWLNQQATPDTTGGVFLWLTSGIPWFVSLIAMAIMMIKPPKILTNLID